MSTLNGTRVAFLATDGVEASEYSQPRAAVEAAGGMPELVSIKPGSIQAMTGMDKSGTFPVDMIAGETDPDGYDGLVLPGGVANPDKLRMNRAAVGLVRAFFDARKPVAAICHGPWTMIDAGVLEGRTLTSYPSLRADLTNAGACWVDEQCHVDQRLVTSRHPADLPAFCATLIEELAEGVHTGQREMR